MLDLYDLTPPFTSKVELAFEDWGLIEYNEALNKQLEYLQQIADTGHPGMVVFCTHPPVVTLGRSTQSGDVTHWTGPLLEVSRGGRATYHGPSQLVVYPLINLKFARKNRQAQEIVGYLRDLENSIIETLKEYGISGVGKSLQKKSSAGSDEMPKDETGVWVGNQKIASLGIAVKKWVTYHGAAINITHDPKAFQGLNPCGFNSSTMVSLEQLLGSPVDPDKFKQKFQKHLRQLL